MITDTDCSKASIFIPCNETINSEGVALLYVNHILPHYGIPQKIISDRDVRFVLRFSTELCRLLNIHQNISTAYHPQTDGASERTNQALEQYLCAFCSTQQNNWHSWLPLTQYMKNSWPSAMTKKTPFNLLIGYTPQAHQPTRKTHILLRSRPRVYKFSIPTYHTNTLRCNNNLTSNRPATHTCHTILIYDHHTRDPDHMAYQPYATVLIYGVLSRSRISHIRQQR